MTFDRDSAKKLDPKVARKMLFMGGLPLDIIAGILLIASIVLFILKMTVIAVIVLAVALVAAFFGLKNLIMSREKKERFLTSKLVGEAIKAQKANGNALSRKEIVKIKFEYDPIFHDKVVAKVHKKADNEYDRKIKNCENKIKSLQNDREKEIKRLAEARWDYVGDEKLAFNMTEGKVTFNKETRLFSDIGKVETVKEDSYRVEAVKKDGEETSTEVPTCNHIGVLVDVNGKGEEIVLLAETVDQSSGKYKKAMKNAEDIIAKLVFLSTVPVPESFLAVENEKSVLEYDKQIVDAEGELEEAKADIPTYAIPEKYL